MSKSRDKTGSPQPDYLLCDERGRLLAPEHNVVHEAGPKLATLIEMQRAQDAHVLGLLAAYRRPGGFLDESITDDVSLQVAADILQGLESNLGDILARHPGWFLSTSAAVRVLVDGHGEPYAIQTLNRQCPIPHICERF